MTQQHDLSQPEAPAVPKGVNGKTPRRARKEALADIWKMINLERNGKLQALPPHGHPRNTPLTDTDRATKNGSASSSSNGHDQAATHTERARRHGGDPSYPNLTGPLKPEGQPWRNSKERRSDRRANLPVTREQVAKTSDVQ